MKKPTDPLMTPAQELRFTIDKKVRAATRAYNRRMWWKLLLSDPELAIAQLLEPKLRNWRDRAGCVIKHREDAFFERAFAEAAKCREQQRRAEQHQHANAQKA